ncbi:MAG: alpha/beta hydrolase [Vicinamibacteria bacterium]|nr:alpha/beta hydrolase [Vicinamibacteria bacterium]
MTETPVLILPGLYDSGPEHWQTLWERTNPGFHRVVQREWARPECAEWVATLDAAIARHEGAVLVAHSSACALVAHWAASHPAGRVRGALLVAPSDPEAPAYPKGPTGFSPMPLVRLGFPSIVVMSANDVYVTPERGTAFARAWGSTLLTIGDAGHINAQSGHGHWPAGLELLRRLRDGS